MPEGTTGVFWDLNTCPVPAGIEPGSVRGRIESALRNYFGGESGPVRTFALGNLQYISREILEAISSSGIPCYHAPCGWAHIYSVLSRWSEHTPHGATIVLISSRNSWCSEVILDVIDDKDFRVLRAFPKDVRPPFLDYPPLDEKEFDWETFLINDKDSEEETKKSLQIVEDDPAWLCIMCQTYSQSWDLFFNHLKTERHKQRMFASARYEDGKPVHFCQVCNYPAYDEEDINIHYKSDEHEQKNKLADKEEDCESKKRTREEDLLNEAKKKSA